MSIWLSYWDSHFELIVHRNFIPVFYSFLFSTCATSDLDRVNDFSDEDEEIDFSSGEYDPNNIAGNGSGNGAGANADRYACKRDLRKYRKLDQTENDGEVDDNTLGANPADSDSEFENMKIKGSRAKISHVSKIIFALLALLLK